MNRSTGIGPSRRMRSLRIAANVPAGAASARVLDIGSCRGALARLAQYPDARDDHRQRVEDAGGEWTEGQEVALVRLAEEFAERAGEAVADEKGACDHAGPPQRHHAMGEPPQNRE